MIDARFIGGTWDGQTKRVVGARRHVVPLVVTSPGHANDVRWVDMASDPKPLKHADQIYTRREIIGDDGRTVEFFYELESP